MCSGCVACLHVSISALLGMHQSHQSHIDKVMHDCRAIVDKQEIANICNLHFVSVGKRLAEGLSNTNIDTISHIATPNEKFTFSKISTEQVK